MQRLPFEVNDYYGNYNMLGQTINFRGIEHYICYQYTHTTPYLEYDVVVLFDPILFIYKCMGEIFLKNFSQYQYYQTLLGVDKIDCSGEIIFIKEFNKFKSAMMLIKKFV